MAALTVEKEKNAVATLIRHSSGELRPIGADCRYKEVAWLCASSRCVALRHGERFAAVAADDLYRHCGGGGR
jgi:hypothetical protein